MKPFFLFLGLLASALAAASGGARAQAPDLPAGPPAGPPTGSPVGSPSGPPPALPSGLGPPGDGAAPPPAAPSSAPPAPVLPAGLGAQATEESPRPPASGAVRRPPPVSIAGFVEARAGVRTQDDPTQKQASIGEIRAQLQGTWEAGPAVINLTTDLLIDPVEDDFAVDLEEGRGAIDLREANVVLRPLEFLDLKVGRQILTWGAGDLVFINDLFPKDFRSFFIGRDDEYLKAPSDAARASVFTDLVNIDVIYTPRFDADRFVSGDRLSYFNPLLGRTAGRDAVIDPLTPQTWFSDDEIALRASRNLGAYEAAAYAYSGFWKGPQGATQEGAFFFPDLSVYGASLRGPAMGGVASLEIGYYDSREDRAGANPLIPNSEIRYLVGYEREAMTNLTLGVQYYAERRADISAARAALPDGAPRPERTRHVLTLRLTKLALNQNLTLGVFNFWSPNEGDGYARGRVGYKLNDDWLVEGGFNAFYGERSDFFGQFQDNSNVFLGARRSF